MGQNVTSGEEGALRVIPTEGMGQVERCGRIVLGEGAAKLVWDEGETAYSEAWERFKELLRACPHHGFMELNSSVVAGELRQGLMEVVHLPAPVKAVEESCVTCGGAHSWYNCPATDNNQASVCATTGTYNQVNPPNRVSNQMAPPGFAPVQNNGQNRFNQNQVQGNNFRGNNFHGNQGFQAQNNHAPNFQNQPFQVPNNQVQQEISNDFSSYKRNNDQMLRNMQNQINSLKGDLKNVNSKHDKTLTSVMINQQPLSEPQRYSSTNTKRKPELTYIDAVCESIAPKLLGFSNSSGGNPTPMSEPFTSEFILEEIEAYQKDD
ncbi:hypothetical protein Tco_0183738 [Tanacetum coccineum]